MRILTYTGLYPSAAQPGLGLFVEQRLRQLLGSGEVEARVIAPVPWFPFKVKCFGKYATFAGVSKRETRFGIDVVHPRYPVIPKVGTVPGPYLMRVATEGAVRELLRDGYDFDLIDAHYFFPDGVSATWLGRRLGKPVVVTARGSDINLLGQMDTPRKLMVDAARHLGGIVAVSRALKDAMVAMGMPAEKIVVLRNGVDLDVFRPLDRAQARRELGFEGRTLLSVGNLLELKGHHIAIEALRELDDTGLVIAGEGPERSRLEALAQALGVSERVRFEGRIEQTQLVRYYNAADALVLASSREGWANVLLESMACGTPVIATAVSGNPEVVGAPAAGLLMDERTPQALVHAERLLRTQAPSRAETRVYAEQFDWSETTRGQIRLFDSILEAAS